MLLAASKLTPDREEELEGLILPTRLQNKGDLLEEWRVAVFVADR